MTPEAPKTEKTQATSKKEYKEPQLREYGDFRQITQTGRGPGPDNPGSSMSHTA
jgi:hypothetical protein